MRRAAERVSQDPPHRRDRQRLSRPRRGSRGPHRALTAPRATPRFVRAVSLFGVLGYGTVIFLFGWADGCLYLFFHGSYCQYFGELLTSWAFFFFCLQPCNFVVFLVLLFYYFLFFYFFSVPFSPLLFLFFLFSVVDCHTHKHVSFILSIRQNVECLMCLSVCLSVSVCRASSGCSFRSQQPATSVWLDQDNRHVDSQRPAVGECTVVRISMGLPWIQFDLIWFDSINSIRFTSSQYTSIRLDASQFHFLHTAGLEVGKPFWRGQHPANDAALPPKYGKEVRSITHPPLLSDKPKLCPNQRSYQGHNTIFVMTICRCTRCPLPVAQARIDTVAALALGPVPANENSYGSNMEGSDHQARRGAVCRALAAARIIADSRHTTMGP